MTMDFTESEVMGRDEEGGDSGDDALLAHRAAADGDIETLSRAIQADPAALEYQDSDGLTPLAYSVTSEQLESLKLLVKMGTNINAQDSLGRTCLSIAAYQSWYDGVVFLLRNGAKQTVTDKSGRTPLHSSTYNISTIVLKGLLHSLSVDDINQQDNEGMSALHWSSFHNRAQHMEILIAKGAEVNIRDIDGKTALHWAAQNGSVECCARLVNDPQGASLITQLDGSGKAAMHYAAAAGHCAVIRQLAAVPGCDLESEDPDERTPLHWAAATGQSQAVSTLLELNANPAPVDVEGATPLEYAHQANHQECIEILEESLGLNASSNGNFSLSNTNTGNNISIEQNRGRKNPLGFIVDFFRPKKAKNNHIEVSDENQVTSNESDSSTAEYNINNRNLNQRTRLGGSSSNLQENNSDEVRLSTTRRQKESEVLKSIEKLHVSRTDNPVLQNRTPAKHPEHLPVGSPVSNTNTSTSSEGESTVDHSMLIRSPPPIIKHEGPFSPAPDMGPGWGRDHARLEEDAAQILAVHDNRWSNYGSTTSLTTSKSLTPLPAISPRGCTSAELSITLKNQDSFVGQSSMPQFKSHSLQLAPLRGPIPQLNNRAAQCSAVNKTLESIRKIPTSGLSRSPTPPAWPSSSANSNSLSHSLHPSPRSLGNKLPSGNSHRKKKKKKKIQNTENSLNIDENDRWTDTTFETSTDIT